MSGITFDYSYAGQSCQYTITAPDESKREVELENTQGSHLIDTAVRYTDKKTLDIESMFNNPISGMYDITLHCYGQQNYEQSASVHICADCIIQGECVAPGTFKGNTFCSLQKKVEHPGFFQRLWIRWFGP